MVEIYPSRNGDTPFNISISHQQSSAVSDSSVLQAEVTYFRGGNAASECQTADLTPIIETTISIVITLSVAVFAAFYWRLPRFVTRVEFMVAILVCVYVCVCRKSQKQCMTARGALPWMRRRILPGKNQNNAPGLRCHCASTACSLHLCSCSRCACKHPI